MIVNNESTISAILLEPGMEAKVITISNSLKSFQEVVGGHIEVFMPSQDDIAMIVYEDAKIRGEAFNRAIYQEGRMVDIIAGKCLIVYAPFDLDNFASLPNELMHKYLEVFRYPEQFRWTDEGIVTSKITQKKEN